MHRWWIAASLFASRRLLENELQCSPANPAQAGDEAVGLADLSGLPSSFCVLVGEYNI